MRVTATVTWDGDKYLAECLEVDRMGEGATEAEAIACLRAALDEYFRESPSVAPPEHEEVEPIEIVVTDRPGTDALTPGLG